MKVIMKIEKRLISICLSVLILSINSFSQNIRWLRVSELQSPLSETGAEYETQFNLPGTTSNFFSWPSQYSSDQTVTRMKGLWIGCRNFNDPVEQKVKSVKVIGSGPKSVADPNQIFPVEVKLIGKYDHPHVFVDDASATLLDNYDLVDEIDEDLPCDRMVLIRFNTSMGITVTKKVMVFANPEHGNYFIHDYVFKNTGEYNNSGGVLQQTLDSVWFYFHYRYAFAGVSVGGDGGNSTWGFFNSVWGESTLNHSFGADPNSSEFTDPNSPFYQLRGFYSYYGPVNANVRPPYDEDWGAPKLDEPGSGTLGSAKFAGCVTLHADTDPHNQSDDVSQPRTTWYLSPDIPITSSTSPSQYDETFMFDRWAAITEGHPTIQHDDAVGQGNYAASWLTDSRRNAGGGVAMGQGYGPYRLEPGDSVHIVFAEAVSGISWEKGREVGSRWLQWRNGTGNPTLVLPNGSNTTDYNEYKRAWVVDAGRDSILKTYKNAVANFQSGYTLPQPPPPPSEFSVLGGGDRIQLTWSNNAPVPSYHGGYVIYRSRGNVLDWNTTYDKIFETNDPNVNTFDDTDPVRGFDYYYYIQAKDNGTQTEDTLYSSLFWTVTSVGAVLGRPAGSALEQVRVVPNPYDIRGRFLQFGDMNQYDRITFYGLPPKCDLKIFTERGDLVSEISHTRPTGDEIWDSKTSSGQIVVSGIYILYVEVTEDIYDTYIQNDGRLLFRKGDSIFRKFVIIR
jgi:hypothetical protein